MTRTTYAIYENPSEGRGVATLTSCGGKVRILATGTKTDCQRWLRHQRRAEDVSASFRSAYESHPQQATDPALALQSAREIAARTLRGLAGMFDDQTLRFLPDDGIPA
jgi:hypothetical protein